VALRFLITGIGGFVGGHLAAHLRERYPDADLHGTVLHATEGAKVQERLSALDVRLHALDSRDEGATRHLLTEIQPDRIVHLAGQAFIPRSFESPWETIETNLRGALNLFEGMRAARLLNTRILIVGSADVYGIVPSEALPLPESAPLNPTSPYGVSKAAQDMLAAQYARSMGLHTIRVRPFNHIGPGQSNRFAAADWASQIAEAELGAREPIVRVGDLSPARDFTDVRDVVRAYALLLETARAGEVFNICQGVPVRMEVILNTLIRLSRVPITVTVDAARLRPSDIPMLYGDSTALRACTGWQPVYTLEQSLSDILNQWRKFHTTQETQ